MRKIDALSRFAVSASVIALGAVFAAPAFAQGQPAGQPDCSTIQDEAQRQACAQSVEQVDPLANTGEADTTTGGASADSTQAGGGSIVITGSRLRRDERTSADPITVIDPNVETREGKLNTAQVLQTSPLAAGSTQITSTISSNFVVNGGEGVETISLRGLGANRTLVLLNGRRAGPAGVRGGVSAFDLNVLPVEAISQIDILKTGASSIYGSDAIAGVVNLITKKDLRGVQVRGFASIPTTQGADEKSLSVLGGFGLGDRGHVMVGVDWYKRNALKRGDRSYLGCEEEFVFSEATGERSDPIDPRTGEPYCGGFSNAQIFLTDFFGAPNLCGPEVPIRPPAPITAPCGPTAPGFNRRRITSIQFNYPGSRLDEFLPPLAPATDPFGRDLVAPEGFFPVGAHTATALAMANNYNSQLDQDSVIPRTKRFTIFGEAGYDLTDDINLYFEGLYNRRKTRTIAHRQLFFYQFPGDSTTPFGYTLPQYFCAGGFFSSGEQCDPNATGDPLNTGFTFPGLLLPVIIAPFNSGTDVKYFRGVAGIRADLKKWLPHGFADFYFQHSRSDGDYDRQIIFRDAVEFGVAAWRTDLCEGTVTAIRGVPCMDINYTDPRVLRGEFTDAERAFLFGVDKGNTLYKQDTAELSFGGDLFELPGGPLKFALGGQYRRDSINDVPGEATLQGNLWGSTSSGITKGFQRTTEVFGEVEVPLLRDITGVKELTFNGAARLTNVYAKRTGPVCDADLNCVFDGASDKDNGNWTYKIAGNYAPTSFLRLRATYGTSFRSPALFEQFLANESGFLGQGQIDPCINYGLQDNPQIAANCASEGIPPNYVGAGGSAETFAQGGIGLLDPERSKALTLSAIFTPEGWLWRGGQFSFAVDYIDIKVRDQVTQLGAANIVAGCYTSESYPDDPLCDLFDRVPDGGTPEFSITNVRDPFLNIDTQHNKSLDFTTRFRQNMGNWGTLSMIGQLTYQLKDRFTLFQGVEQSFNGKAGDPKWVGDLTVSWTKNPVTLTYGLQVIAGTNDKQNLIDANGEPVGPTGGLGLPGVPISNTTPNFCLASDAAFALRGGPYCPVYKLPRVAYHSLSAEIQATNNFTFTVGVANIFNKKPPAVSTVGSPITGGAFAQVPLLGSYYDLIGRRVFVTARAKLGGLLGL
ncbi:MAG TPA: TonB-dependent receptor [Sphingomicrobium sp.]|nr:TonB-dependent receptor [Sphingomicrobium sp.]